VKSAEISIYRNVNNENNGVISNEIIWHEINNNIKQYRNNENKIISIMKIGISIIITENGMATMYESNIYYEK
jgi:hypothetical protein